MILSKSRSPISPVHRISKNFPYKKTHTHTKEKRNLTANLLFAVKKIRKTMVIFHGALDSFRFARRCGLFPTNAIRDLIRGAQTPCIRGWAKLIYKHLRGFALGRSARGQRRKAGDRGEGRRKYRIARRVVFVRKHEARINWKMNGPGCGENGCSRIR